MKVLSKTPFIMILLIMVRLFPSCGGNASFTRKEMRFLKPFENDQVLIFKSKEGQMDTINFFKSKIDTIKYRNIEQGFYNENALNVGYELSNNSFHKISVQSVDKEPERFLLFLKAKNSHSSREISFLGLVFNDDYIKKILDTKENSVVFSDENAQYRGVNINEGIKSFTFDFNNGIISFIDKKGEEWVRIK